MKDSRYKIVIENVNCAGEFWNNTPFSGCIEPCDTCELRGRMETGLNKEQTAELLTSLKRDLQRITDNYEKYIKTPSATNDDW